MNRTVIRWGAVVLVLSLAIGATWQISERRAREREISDTLQPVAALLVENRKIIHSLQSEGYADSESSILESYLARIRKDGVPKYSAMKRNIDTLVNNNTAIMALLSKYTARARTSGFSAGADRYRDYSSALRDRWQSVFEIFMAGGNLPQAGPTMPAGMEEALKKEMVE